MDFIRKKSLWNSKKGDIYFFSNSNVIFLHHPRAIGCTCNCFVRILASHVSSRLTCHDSFSPFFLKPKISAKSPFTSFHNNFRGISVLGGFGQKAGAGVRVHQISHIRRSFLNSVFVKTTLRGHIISLCNFIHLNWFCSNLLCAQNLDCEPVQWILFCPYVTLSRG